jgi:enamine deaminase RidA (YjgF/YER057c/UK114 family)
MAGQTTQTLDNIEALIAGPNLERQGVPGLGATLDDLVLLRVYVKHQDDFEVARDICDARLSGVPTVYTVADVCRPELLIEMEGVAIAHKG